MNKNLGNIFHSDNFKEKLCLESNILRKGRKLKLIISISLSFILLSLFLLKVFDQNINNLKDVWIFISFHFIFLNFHLIFVMSIMDWKFFDMIINWFFSKTNEYKKFEKLKLSTNNQIAELEKDVLAYLKSEYIQNLNIKNILELERVDKIDFIDNYKYILNLKEKTRLDIEIKKQLDKLENIYKILNSQNESNYLIDRNRKEGIGDVSSNSSINKLNNRISKKDKKYFPKIINWEELNKLKNDIGKLGEELAFVYEQNRLIDLG